MSFCKQHQRSDARKVPLQTNQKLINNLINLLTYWLHLMKALCNGPRAWKSKDKEDIKIGQMYLTVLHLVLTSMDHG